MALQNAAAGASILAELARIGDSAHEMGQRLFAAIARIVEDVFDTYRPELHYMRGPGAQDGGRSMALLLATRRSSRFGAIKAGASPCWFQNTGTGFASETLTSGVWMRLAGGELCVRFCAAVLH
jgi:hypothetical protein